MQELHQKWWGTSGDWGSGRVVIRLVAFCLLNEWLVTGRTEEISFRSNILKFFQLHMSVPFMQQQAMSPWPRIGYVMRAEVTAQPSVIFKIPRGSGTG